MIDLGTFEQMARLGRLEAADILRAYNRVMELDQLNSEVRRRSARKKGRMARFNAQNRPNTISERTRSWPTVFSRSLLTTASVTIKRPMISDKSCAGGPRTVPAACSADGPR